MIQRQHFGLGSERYPGHIFLAEIVFRRDIVLLENRHIAVQVFAFEGIGDDRLVLHADQIVEPGIAQRQDRPFELPGSSICAREREMP